MTPDIKQRGDYKEGVRWMIVQMPQPLGHYCAYIGIPINSVCAGKSYMGEYDEEADSYNYSNVIPSMNGVHGGWTFSGGYKGFEGWWWYGWDYAHAGDYNNFSKQGHKWTLNEVKAHIDEVLPQFTDWCWALARKEWEARSEQS